MGIQSYFPRFILPGAPQPLDIYPSEPDIAEPVQPVHGRIETSANSQQAGQEPDNTVQPVPGRIDNKHRFPLLDDAGPSGSSLSEASGTREKPEVVARPDDHSPQQAVQEQSKEAPAEIRIQLSFLHINNRICILNQLPYLGKGNLGHAQKKLACNILAALGISEIDEALPESSFKWPMAESKMLDHSPVAALQALKAYLLEKHHELPFDALLIMGSQLSELFNREHDFTENDFPFQLVNTKSLDEMLALPVHKREAWQSLQALKHTD